MNKKDLNQLTFNPYIGRYVTYSEKVKAGAQDTDSDFEVALKIEQLEKDNPLDNYKKQNNKIFIGIILLILGIIFLVFYTPNSGLNQKANFNDYYMKTINLSDQTFKIGSNILEQRSKQNYLDLYKKLYGNKIVFSNEDLENLFKCNIKSCGSLQVPTIKMLRDLAIKNDKVELFDSITLAYLNQVAESKNNPNQPYKFELAETSTPDCDSKGRCVTGVYYKNILYKN